MFNYTLPIITLGEYITEKVIPFQKAKGQKEENWKKTLRMYQIILEYTDIMQLTLGDVNQNDMEMLLARLEQDRNISKQRVNRYRAMLMAIFEHAKKARYLLFNPIVNIKRYREEGRNRVLDYSEMHEILRQCQLSENKELFTIVYIALNTGLRYSEVVWLKKSEIQNDKIILTKDRCKSGHKHSMPLNENVKDVLYKFMSNNDNGDYIFKTRYIKRSFKTALRRAGIDDFRFHDLRRTFATYLHDELNTPIHIVSKLLNHSSIRMTEEYLTCSDIIKLKHLNKLNILTAV